MVRHRFLLISGPVQGHINPTLQFAKRLISTGEHVTYLTTVYMHRSMANKTTIHGLSFATFSDGYDDGLKLTTDDNTLLYFSELKRHGSEAIRNLIASSAQKGNPFTGLAYTPLLPWAASVAREFQLQTVLLWIQPATVFDIYYHYFQNYGDYFNDKMKEPACSIELPGLPFSLTTRDLPSFLSVPSTFKMARLYKEQVQELDLETNPRVLVNTFEELEPEALRAVDKIRMIPIGPLIPSAFLDGKDPNDTSFGGDMFHGSNDYVKWLDSKPELSVVYVSFGSLSVLPKRQMEEVARALLDFGRPFLWVIRERVKEGKEQKEGLKGKEKEEEEGLSCREELEQMGKIVNWCSQVEVLSHPSLGCFVTHCGWNSTLESLVSGVPVVAFPQWTDQWTNAKLIEDVWMTGVRVDGDQVNEEGMVKVEEIRRCLELVMGSGVRGEEMRRNAKKWKGLAREACKEGGSSDKNLRNFLDEVGR